MNPYKALNIDPKAKPAMIEAAWLGLVSHWRPGMRFRETYGPAMEAVKELLGWDCHAESDWLVVYVGVMQSRIPDILDTPEITADQLDTVAEAFKLAPKTVAHERLLLLPEISRVSGLIEELLPLPEFVARELYHGVDDFDILWRMQGMSTKGVTVHGSMTLIPQEVRDLWFRQPAPSYRLRLNLPYWLLLSDTERKQLIHHELCHADRSSGKAKIRPHDMEEHLETITRFGVVNSAQARLVAAAMAHPRTQALLKADPDGQQYLPLTGGGLRPLEAIQSAETGRTL